MIPKLIQFCDAIAISSGFCLVEKRMIDVALRYGINDLIIDKWKSTMELKQYFESKIGKSIYTLLPGVIENTLYAFLIQINKPITQLIIETQTTFKNNETLVKSFFTRKKTD